MFNSELTLPYFNKKKTAYFFVKLSLAFYLCPNSLLCIPLHMYKWTLNLTSSPWDESTFSLGSAWKSFSEEYTSCAGLAVNPQYTSSRDMDEQSHISSFCAERLTILVFSWVQLIKKHKIKQRKNINIHKVMDRIRRCNWDVLKCIFRIIVHAIRKCEYTGIPGSARQIIFMFSNRLNLWLTVDTKYFSGIYNYSVNWKFTT